MVTKQARKPATRQKAGNAEPLNGGVIIGALAVVVLAVIAVGYFMLFSEKRGVKPVLADPQINRMYSPPQAAGMTGQPGK